jgi:hypothetical protein
VLVLVLLLLSPLPGLREKLVGTWESEYAKVVYRDDGTGTSQGTELKWRLDDGNRLTVTYSDGSVLTARVKLDGDVLVQTDIVDTDVTHFHRVKPVTREDLVGRWTATSDGAATKRTYEKLGRAIIDGVEARWSLAGDVVTVKLPSGTVRARVERDKRELVETDLSTGKVTRLSRVKQ